jgi:hypothetical protein
MQNVRTNNFSFYLMLLILNLQALKFLVFEKVLTL